MPDELAVIVLKYLERKQMPVTHLARKSGVGRHIIGRWLAGRRDIRLKHALKIMRTIGLGFAAMEQPHDRSRTQDRAGPRKQTHN